jgi:hypothetical protein
VSGAISVLLIGEPDDLDARVAQSLLEQIAGRPVTVTITAVAARLPVICHWAPVTGQVTLVQMKQLAVERAAEAARVCAALLPEHIPVRHRAVRRWADAIRVASGYDVLVVAGSARRRRVAGLLAGTSHLSVAAPSRTRVPRTAM